LTAGPPNPLAALDRARPSDLVLVIVLAAIGLAGRLVVVDPDTLHMDEALYAFYGLHITQGKDCLSRYPGANPTARRRRSDRTHPAWDQTHLDPQQEAGPRHQRDCRGCDPGRGSLDGRGDWQGAAQPLPDRRGHADYDADCLAD
jgi:hypothetical protein